MDRIRGLLRQHREILSYVFWGAFTAAVSWGSYSGFVLLLRPLLPNSFEGVFSGNVFFAEPLSRVSPTILTANVLSWMLAVSFAFVTNKVWVFESRSWRREVFLPELVKFVSARFATGILEIVGVPLLVGAGLDMTLFGVDGFAAKILATVVVVLLNYVFSKLLIFRR